MSFHSTQLSSKTFTLLPIAKDEFLEHHPKWELSMISNNKIIYEALRYYIGTGKFKNLLQDIGGKNEK